MSVRAHEIKHALSIKHKRTDDFFLTEVKNGPTHTATELYIMDALAIKKSWVNPLFTGYEIKVSRNDFLQDEKWPAYRNYCHRLDFVCPTGIIHPNELPDDVGLIYYNPEKRTLNTRRKGQIRNIEMPYEMLYYILMSRVDSSAHPFFSDKEEYFREWLERKLETRQLGYRIKSELVDRLAEKEEEIKGLNRRIKRIEKYEKTINQIEKILKKHGMNTWYVEGYPERIDEALSSSVPPHLVSEIENIKDTSQRLYDSLKAKG